ncbi:MAG TPA: hypothetical protein PKC93_11300, partial [Candidatus Obscuribacter sp.]|nr:hypothetical protein [Candidatus Obscuribacter sp.]
LAPNDPDSHSNLAWVYSKNKDHLSAVIEYRLALQIDPKNGQLHKALGLEFKDLGDTNSAIAQLLSARKLLPADYEVKLALDSLMPKGKN